MPVVAFAQDPPDPTFICRVSPLCATAAALTVWVEELVFVCRVALGELGVVACACVLVVIAQASLVPPTVTVVLTAVL